MTDITVAKLQDVLNDIERNAYEGTLGSGEITNAYVLAGELGEIIEKLEAKNKKLLDLVDELWAIAYGYAPDESELDCAQDMMRDLGIEVNG